ncbi:MAG TPA: rhamnogalacturonan acetylesterase [Calditrichia bacterium]|nr:rhamnogalacturonan acetylesterase [Calditrichia bacterium]
MTLFLTLLSAAILLNGCSSSKPAQANMPETAIYKFDFGSGEPAPGYIRVMPSTVYAARTGFGFHPDSLQPLITAVSREGETGVRGGFCTSEQPFFFSVDLPREGNYRVTVTLGDSEAASRTTVKAELRRLMLRGVETEPGEFVRKSFIANTRTPDLPGGGKVNLHEREQTFEAWAWDNKLTLEFSDRRPALCALEIEPADNLSTIYLLGNSTVCDQAREPYNSWGQMLTAFFQPEVAIANHAESGETISGAIALGRLTKIYSLIRPGDYLLMQFGHNDMKLKGEGIGAFTSFKSDVVDVVREIRRRGAFPVLITPVQRRNFDENNRIVNSHEDYPEAMRRAAREENVPLIDLHALSKILYEAFGPEESIKLFSVPEDRTHHNNFGSYQLARCIVQGIIDNRLEIAQFVREDWQPYHPAHPDAIAEWDFPTSPRKKPLP